jgi:hypothetical protein
MALKRNGLGNGLIAVRDPIGIDTPAGPVIPPPGTPASITFANIPTPLNWGPRFSTGISFGQSTIEAIGYFLLPTSGLFESTDVSKIDLLFGSFPPPVGFGGNLWSQADFVRIRHELMLGDGQINFRYQRQPWLEWIAGLRYMYLEERINIFVDDDGKLVPPPITARQVNYGVKTQNNFVAGQLGFGIENRLVPIFSLNFEAKGAAGANFVHVEQRLDRGDQFPGPSGKRDTIIPSALADLNLFATLYFGNNIRLRGGYNAMWFINVPQAHQQINFNPAIAGGTVNNNGTIFLHGPMVELQVGF